MLSSDESQQLGLTFVKNQFLKRTGLQYTELVELLKTEYIFPDMPKSQSISIMENIHFSYGFLQALIYPSDDPNKKYERLLGWLIPALLKDNGDPCKLEEALTEEEMKQKNSIVIMKNSVNTQ